VTLHCFAKRFKIEDSLQIALAGLSQTGLQIVDSDLRLIEATLAISNPQ
jgi:hypothetical protein